MKDRRIAVMLSGRGSNFLAIADAIKQGTLKAEIACVISDQQDAQGLHRARELGLDALFMSAKNLGREAYDQLVVAELLKREVALVCLAGFMRILTPYFINTFPNKILNIHPSLLPAFPGLEAQRQALEHGVKFSGCTVHLVNEGVDTGPIVLQAAVPILDSDTVESLSARILQEEHKIYSQAIALMLDRRVKVVGRKVYCEF